MLPDLDSYPPRLPDGTTGNDLTLDDLLTLPFIQFNIEPLARLHEEGLLIWNDDEKCLNIGMAGGVVNLQVGLEVLIRGKNGEGVQIDNGTPVYIKPGVGPNAEFGIASKDVYEKALLIGVATEDISAGGFGYACAFGLARDIDTSLWARADILWLHDNGAISNVAPIAGADTILKVALGFVWRSHAEEGIIFVRPEIIQRLIISSDMLTAIPSPGDIIQYTDNTRFELKKNYSEKTWPFESKIGSTGTVFYGGFYEFETGNDDFTTPTTLGTVNIAKAAHVGFVLGADTVDEITLEVSGTSITDGGVRTGSDTEIVTIPNGSLANAYFETAKKWNGQVSIVKTGGTAKPFNWGFVKYWDNSNQDFEAVGFEVLWLGGANDTDPDIEFIHHKTTGWTYQAASTPDYPVVASHRDIQAPEHQIAVDQHGAFKRDDLSVTILGSANEGTLWAVTGNANRAVEEGGIMQRIAAL